MTDLQNLLGVNPAQEEIKHGAEKWDRCVDVDKVLGVVLQIDF